jgi:hypothetical protein
MSYGTYGYDIGRKSIPEEKAMIKAALGAQVMERQTWQVISMQWFERWKTYVNFDEEGADERTAEQIEALHPGKVDNTSIEGAHENELKMGITEARDYVLLPGKEASYLYEKYEVIGRWIDHVQVCAHTYAYTSILYVHIRVYMYVYLEIV